MKKINGILWGIVLIAVGTLLALNTLDILPFNLFFDGWWTLLILVPCVLGLITGQDRTFCLTGIVIGTVLLLWRQNVVDLKTIWKLCVPALIIIIGLRLIFSNIFDRKSANARAKLHTSNLTTGHALFSGRNMNLNGQTFEGAELSAVFGGVTIDLRGAQFPEDCAIEATAVFGGIDILVPPFVNVKVKTIPIFGGVSNKSVGSADGVTLYVNSTCIFGGIDIK